MANMFESRKRVESGGTLSPYLGLYLDWNNAVNLVTTPNTEFSYTTPSKGAFVFSYLAQTNGYMKYYAPNVEYWANVIYINSSQESFTQASLYTNLITAKSGEVFKLKLQSYDNNAISSAFIPFKDQTIKVLDWSNTVYYESGNSNFVTPSDGAIISSSDSSKYEGIYAFKKGTIYIPKDTQCNLSSSFWFVPLES